MNKSGIVVFDNNAIISAAILKNSVPAKAFDLAIRDYKVVFSFDTLIELQDVLFREKFDKYVSVQDRKQFLNYFLLNAFEVQISCVISDCRDVKDNKFLELAVDAQAEFIISGDKDLLVLNPFGSISIITPYEFLQKV